METYLIKLTGETPLLMHWDNIDWCEVMQKWGKDPANKKNSVAGDDRTPAFRWLGNLYHEAGRVVIPADNLMTVLREGGAKVPTGKKGATFKRQTQSGLLVNESAWRLTIGGAEIDAAGLIKTLKNENDFEVHQAEVEKLGFTLFIKRARIGQAKHIRVRPRFDKWECSGTISVLDDSINKDTLQTILTYAGVQCGLGDWRPSSPKSPGPFGRFAAEVSRKK
jgi:hypothetical protein